MQRRFKRVEYSPDVDALVITLSEEKPAFGEDIGESIIIHFSKDRNPVEIEILDASELLVSSLRAITLKARERSS